MNDTEIALKRMETELGEWKEVYGTRFPTFLNYTLMARLIEAKEEVEYLRRCLNSTKAFR